MRVVQLSIRCNNACIFCAQAGLCDEPPDRDVVSAAREASSLQQPVAFCGGEPTLDEDLGRMVRLVREHGVDHVVLQTNGRRLAYANYTRELADAGVSALDISLHGSTQAMHDYHTTVPGSFDQTVRGISRAADAGLEVVVSCVVTRSNLRHLSEVARLARAAGAQAIRFRFPEVTGRAAELQLRVVPHEELVVPMLRRAHADGARVGLPVFHGDSPRGPFVDFISAQVLSDERSPVVRKGTPELLPLRPRPGRLERRGRERRSGVELHAIPLRLASSSTEGS